MKTWMTTMSAVFVALTSGSISAGADSSDAVKQDLKKLEGNWQMVRQEMQGTLHPQAEKHSLLFDGDQYTFLREKTHKIATAKVTIEPTQDPKTIDLDLTSGSARGHKQLGIYRFTEDGGLEICLSMARGKGSEKRPTKFTTTPSVGSGSIMYVVKRLKD